MPADNSIWGPSCGSKDPYDRRRPYIILSTCRPSPFVSLSPGRGLGQGSTGPNEVIEGNHADQEVTGHHDQPGRFRIGCNIVPGLVGGRTMRRGGNGGGGACQRDCPTGRWTEACPEHAPLVEKMLRSRQRRCSFQTAIR